MISSIFFMDLMKLGLSLQSVSNGFYIIFDSYHQIEIVTLGFPWDIFHSYLEKVSFLKKNYGLF